MRYNTLGIQVTNTCNMACQHCITDSSPQARGDLTWPQIEAAVRGAAAHVDGVCVTGGEPLLRRDLTLRTIRLTRELGLRSSMVTNGYWARSNDEARAVWDALESAGLQKLAVSFDRFHDRIVSGGSLDVLLATGAGRSVEMQVQYCGDRADEAYRIAATTADRHGVALVTAEVLPFGRGRKLAIRRGVDPAAIPDDPCGVAVRPVLTPEGELFTCCGPARGAAPHSPLRLSIRSTGEVGAALSAGAAIPILNVIHNRGPRALFNRLSPELRERVSKRLLDGSICSLCRAITDDRDAVAALEAALEPERLRLVALSAVMRAAQDELAVG
uniref:radical SAM protein n=1 Tax=Pseudonocardia sp. CA-138482 TaxID=3240023 RepID=UPI003F499B55